ncbi:TPA: Ig-like domain-containing protein [Providencia alcalifaciens]
MNSNNINTIQVKNFKVQGLDLIITTPDGKTEILKNGLSDVILGDVVLSTEQGVVLTQDEILSSISMNVGADAVYIKEQFVSDTVEVDVVEQKKQNNEEGDAELRFEETLAELQQKNKALSETVRTLESSNEEKKEQLSSSLTKLNQAKNELNQKTKAEDTKIDITKNDLSSPASSTIPSPSTPLSSTPSSVNKAKDVVMPLKTNIFIQGRLDDTTNSDISSVQITKVNTPTFIGKVSLDATAYLEIAGKKYPINADQEGNWSLSINTALPDDAYEYQLVASRADDKPVIVEGNIIIDTTLPEVTVHLASYSDSGGDNDAITHQTLPTFMGKTEPKSVITLVIAGQHLSTAANEQGEWRITVAQALPEGELTYQVTAVDKADNSQTIHGVVTIKTTLPDATTYLENTDNFITNKAMPVLLGQTDAQAVVTINLAGQIYTTKADDQGHWSFAVPEALHDGHHLFLVTVTDIAGNQASFTENMHIDTAHPSSHATLSTDTDSGLIGDQLTNHTKPTLIGKTKPHATVTIHFENQDYPVTADTAGEWTWSIPQVLANGIYDYQITVNDLAGNTSTDKGSLTVDTQVELTAKLDTTSQSEHAVDGITTNLIRPQISGTSEPKSKITAEFKGTTKTAYTDENGHWSLTFDTNAAVGKENNYRIIAEDLAGNKTTIEQQFTFVPLGNGASEAPLPTLSVMLDERSDSGVKEDYITNINTLSFKGLATKGAKVSFDIGGKRYETTADHTTGKWEIKTETLQDGNNRYIVTATHPINGRSLDVQGSVFIDSMLPISTIELTSETDTGTKGNFITSHHKPVFTGQGEVGCQVTLTLNNETIKTTTDKHGQWSLQLSKELPKDFIGNYQIIITDAAGNVYEKTSQLVIESHAPYLSEISLDVPWKAGKFDGAKSTNDLTPDFSGEASPNSTLKFEFERVHGGKSHKFSFPITNIDEKGHWTFSIPEGTLLKDSGYLLNNITVIATSPAGHVSQKVFDKVGMQVKDSVLHVTSQVAAISSSTGMDDNYLSVSRSPKLKGTISGSADRDELRGVIKIAGKSYGLTLSNGRKNWEVQLPDTLQLPKGDTPFTLEFTDVYGSTRTYSSYVTVSDFKIWLDPDTDTTGNHYTSHQKPAYKGKVEPGAMLYAKIDGKSYPVDMNANGEWRFEVPIHGEGAYPVAFMEENSGLTIGQVTLNILTTAPKFDDFYIKSSELHSGTKVANNSNAGLRITYTGNIDYYMIEVNGKIYKHTTKLKEFNGKETMIGESIRLPNGIYPAKITAFDMAGNKTEHELELKVLSGAERDIPPKVEFELNGKQFTSAENSKLMFNSDALSLTGKTTSASHIEIKDANGKVIGSTQADNGGNWRISLPKTSIPFNLKQDEEIKFTVTAQDLIGRETHLNFNLVYDIQPPEITAELEDVLSLGHQTNDNTPTLSGQTKANATVTIIIDGKTHQVTADTAGHWLFTLPDDNALKDGHYDYQITATDILGQVSTQSLSGSVQIKTAPLVEVGLDSDSDSGVQNDNITNTQKPKLRGMTEPNADVRVIFDNQLAQPYQTKSDQNGHWFIEVTSELAEGHHDYIVTVNDVKQGIRGEMAGEFTIDLTAPTELTAGVWHESEQVIKNTVLTNSATPTFKGQSEPFALVILSISKVGSHTIDISQTVRTDENGSWVLTLPISSALEDGQYVYRVAVEDSAGNLGEANTEQTGVITVDTQAPALTADTPLTLTNLAQPTFSGETEAGLTVTLEIDGKHYHNTADQDGKWQIQVEQPLSDGKHDYKLTVADAAGNHTEQRGSLTVDTQAPTLAEDTPLTLTNLAQPRFSGETEAGLKVTLEIDGKHYHNTADQDGKWQIQVGDVLSEGDHDYQLTVADAAGNHTEQHGSLTVDTQAPTLAEDTPLTLTNLAQPRFSGETEAGLTVTLEIEGKQYHSTADQHGKWQIQVGDVLSEGDHDYQLTVADAAGNHTEQHGSLTVDTQAPTLAEDTPLTLTNLAQPRFSGETEAGLTVMLEIEGKQYHSTADQHGKWQIHVGDALSDGKHDYQLTVADAAGNHTEQHGSLTVDTQAPTLAEDTPLTLTNQDQPTFSGETEAGLAVMLEIDGKRYHDTADQDGKWQIQVGDVLSEGDHDYQLTVADAAGNHTEQRGSLTVDTQAPTLAEDTPLTLTNQDQPTFSGETEAGLTVTLEIDGKHYHNTADQDGKWQIQVEQPLSDGKHDYQLTVADAAGNHTEQRGSLTVDTQAPTLAEDTPLTLTNQDQPTFSGETEAGLTVTLEIDGKQYHSTADQHGKWQIQMGDVLSEGDHDYQLTVVDAAGNHTEQRGLLTVDTQKTPSGVNQPPAKDHVMDAIPLDMVSMPEEQDNYF